MTTKNCGNCRWAVPQPGVQQLECRRNAPSPVLVQGDLTPTTAAVKPPQGYLVIWPMVEPTHWCRDWGLVHTD